MLEARGVVVSLAGRTVLAGVDLTVERGEVVALLAPSGAGKSTLLRALVRLVEPEAGTIALDGVDTRTLDARRLRRRVGFVAQAPAMLPGSVAENVGYAIDGLAPARLAQTLAAAGLPADFGARIARETSGGERARAALARALAREPEILLLDEPTGALDGETAQRIGATLRSLGQRDGLGICVATHDVAFAAEWADREVRL